MSVMGKQRKRLGFGLEGERPQGGVGHWPAGRRWSRGTGGIPVALSPRGRRDVTDGCPGRACVWWPLSASGNPTPPLLSGLKDREEADTTRKGAGFSEDSLGSEVGVPMATRLCKKHCLFFHSWDQKQYRSWEKSYKILPKLKNLFCRGFTQIVITLHNYIHFYR